ncbi:unnamed protein product [Mytilus coruscus]|uniref:Reverse transcriptase domain-containing protein n=1 Tax=Mytilus coruscus TaxID=42192 RepID=A0A6J8AFT3_MYTCO|nr:unnamed protein product [Mytilus coruscus]
MSTKELDQAGRAGAFHHIIRRQMCMTDTSMFLLHDSRDISDLPLTGEGVFGDNLVSALKARKDKDKTLDDLLPDIFPKDRKRKTPLTDDSSKAKKAKIEKSDQNKDKTSENFRIPKVYTNTGNRKFIKKTDDGKFSKPDTGYKKTPFPARGGKSYRKWQGENSVVSGDTTHLGYLQRVSVVAAHLRKQGIRLAVYLDDWLLVDQQKSVLVKNRDTTITLLTSLGFIINTEKSDLIPTQTISYKGGLFRLDLGLVYPTPERIKNFKITIIQLMKGQISARHYLKVLGLIASCLELIPNSRLFMRPIQMHLLQVWRPSKMSLEYQIPCTQELKAHLAWWLCQANTMKGRSLFQESTSVTITTDASMTGLGTFRDWNSTGSVVDKSIGIAQSHKQSGVGSSIPNSQTCPSYLKKTNMY